MHIAMVSDAHGFLAQGFDYADQLLYRYRPVKGRVIRVVMASAAGCGHGAFPGNVPGPREVQILHGPRAGYGDA